MRVLGIVWLGVQTQSFEAMDAFVERLMGGPASRTADGFRLWSFPNGDIIELYAGGTKPGFEGAPVVGFRVDDIEEGRRVLDEAGVEIVGGYGPNEAGYQSIHFRAPDGNVYELTYDPDHERRATGA